MGEQAEYLLEGDDDYVTGEYLGPGPGYPRTMTNRTAQAKSKNAPDSIKNKFPSVNFVSIQGGWQAKYGGYTITFYPSKKKYNYRGSWGAYTNNAEIPALIITRLNLPWEAKKEEGSTEEIGGVQTCINHIKRKITVSEHINGNTAVLNMLKTLCQEFEQYL